MTPVLSVPHDIVRMIYVTDKHRNTNRKSNIKRSAGRKKNYGNISGLHTDE